MDDFLDVDSNASGTDCVHERRKVAVFLEIDGSALLITVGRDLVHDAEFVKHLALDCRPAVTVIGVKLDSDRVH